MPTAAGTHADCPHRWTSTAPVKLLISAAPVFISATAGPTTPSVISPTSHVATTTRPRLSPRLPRVAGLTLDLFDRPLELPVLGFRAALRLGQDRDPHLLVRGVEGHLEVGATGGRNRGRRG